MPIRSPEDKKRVEEKLKHKIPIYEKGNPTSISKIAENYLDAKENGKWSLQQIKEFGLPSKENVDIRNEWLYKTSYTFTTVHEAIEHLESLRS